MRGFFRGMHSRLSLFWRYFFLLAVVVCMFLVALTFTTRQSGRTLQETYLAQVEASFYSNCDAFSEDIQRVSVLPSALEGSDAWFYSNRAQTPLEPMDSLFISRLGEKFNQQCLLMNISGESFIYLGRAGACVVRVRYFQQAEDCFASYLDFGNQGEFILELEQMLDGHSASGLVLLPVREVSVGGAQPEPYLTLLLTQPMRRQVYGFLYSVQEILDYFHIGTLPEDTTLEIVQSDGTVLFSHNGGSVDSDQYAQFSAPLTGLSATVHVGIPQSYFQNAIREVQNTAHLILLCCVVLGLLMCVVYSHISVRPFRRLIRAHTMKKTEDAPENELEVIDSFLKSTQQRSSELCSMLLSSFLVRAFSGLPIRDDERANLSAAVPLFQQPLQAAIVRDRAANHAIEDDASMIRLLKEALPESFLCEYINIQESIVLFQADADHYRQLEDTLVRLNRQSDGGPRFVCGVSAPFIGLGEIRTAIRQAQLCIPEDNKRMMILFTEDLSAQPTPSDAAILDLRQFRQALEGWNQRGALALVEQMALTAGQTNAPRAEGIFYNVLFLLQDTAYANKTPFDQYEGLAYQHNATPAANLRRLKPVVNALFEHTAVQAPAEKQPLSDKEQLCSEIVQYAKEHFSDVGLCLFSLAKEFDVTERFVHYAFLPITGMNFSTFLAQIRIQEAARLLRETDEPINTVAERCGYPAVSTFYRNFKKYYHVTPAEYKEACDPRNQAARTQEEDQK